MDELSHHLVARVDLLEQTFGAHQLFSKASQLFSQYFCSIHDDLGRLLDYACSEVIKLVTWCLPAER
jgi:primosomal protein N''